MDGDSFFEQLLSGCDTIRRGVILKVQPIFMFRLQTSELKCVFRISLGRAPKNIDGTVPTFWIEIFFGVPVDAVWTAGDMVEIGIADQVAQVIFV